MMNETFAEILAEFTVAEFKAFKKALAILVRARLDRAQAIEILIAAHNARNQWKRTA